MLAWFAQRLRGPRCFIGIQPHYIQCKGFAGSAAHQLRHSPARARATRQAYRSPYNRTNKHGLIKLSVHQRRTVFGACVVAAAMLSAAPISAAPTDYTFDVQEIGPHHSHITVRLRNTSQGNKPVDGANVFIGAHASPETESAETMVEQFLARPGPGTGRYTIIIEPGLTVYSLSISADVPGEAPGSVAAEIPLR